MLRQVEKDLRQHYYDPTFHGVDLTARVHDAEQRLQTAAGFNDAVESISDLLAELDDSHTAFLPPTRSVRVDYGWEMALVGDVPLVVRVEPGSDAAAKGLAPGDRVLLLNAVEPKRGNLERLAYFYRYVRPQAMQRVAILKPDGSARTLDVRSAVERHAMRELRDVLIELGDAIERARDRSETVGADTLVWRMAVFRDAEHVAAMIGKARGYKTLILDLRGNGGGAVEALRALVSRCWDREVHITDVQQRSRRERRVAKPARSRFDGRLIVLVDSRSASAAEIFARVVQIEKRGDVIGDRTAGAVRSSRVLSHKAGAVGVVYGLSVTIGDVVMSDGASLEKVGVVPDEIILPSPADLAVSRDPVLARAIALAGGSMTSDQAGHLFK